MLNDPRPSSAYAAVDLILGEDGCARDTGNIGQFCHSLQWSSWLNNGYQLVAKIDDPGFKILKMLNVESGFFRSGMACKFKARCRLKMERPVIENSTQMTDFYVTSIADGSNSSDRSAFVVNAVDAASWYLSNNPASGKAYRGCMSDVIRQVVSEFAPGINLRIDNTVDSKQNVWYTFRQSPKSMIMRMLGYGSSFLPSKGRFVVVSQTPNIISIVDQSKLQSKNRGFYAWSNSDQSASGTIMSYKGMKQNAWARFAAEMYTAGISTATGLYLDNITDDEHRYISVTDKNTQNKINVKIAVDRGFNKPQDGEPPEIGRTFVRPIPELYSAGEIGLKYRDYISGRARQLYFDNQYEINRLAFDTTGQGDFFDGTGLGSDTITLEFLDADGQPFYIQGDWIIYGYKHAYDSGIWRTKIYVTRLSRDSTAKIVG